MQLEGINNRLDYQGRSIYAKAVASPEEKIDALNKKIDTIKTNVRPATIIAGAGIMYAAFKKGKDVVPYVRKFAITGGEYIAKTAVKAANGIVVAAKKLAKRQNIDGIGVNEITNGINKWAEKSRNVEYTDLKMFNGIKEVSGKLLGNEKTEKIIGFMQDNGLTNKSKLFDAAVATAIGYKAADGASDVIENTADDIQIKDEVKKVLQSF